MPHLEVHCHKLHSQNAGKLLLDRHPDNHNAEKLLKGCLSNSECDAFSSKLRQVFFFFNSNSPAIFDWVVSGILVADFPA